MKYYPTMNSFNDYNNYANEIFKNPQAIIYDSSFKDYYYLRGKDLLRVGLDGSFISLYPGVDTARVPNTIKAGGAIWGL